MIHETGTVVAIESDCLWVETLQKSTCGGCAARQGCGQRLLSRLTGQTNRIRVLCDSRVARSIQLGEQVAIGIPENLLVTGAALVYLLPVLGLMIAAGWADYIELSEWLTAVLGVVGLLIGASLVRWHAWRRRNDERYCPILLGGGEGG